MNVIEVHFCFSRGTFDLGFNDHLERLPDLFQVRVHVDRRRGGNLKLIDDETSR